MKNCLAIRILFLVINILVIGCSNHQEVAERATRNLTNIVGSIAIEMMKLQGVDGSLAPWNCYKDPDQINIWCWDESKKRFIKSVEIIDDEKNMQENVE